ncbi:hypothetical protein HYPSUDRAFT_63917 [Hypholoma sublateritium FD-334 SS-4]|uniref:tripeptidyl-peptidase II n=1 Tax=Hypholoma sublateritium (strain FD-334 SS-4) TaxID=945553 RepID=A0A0D2P5L4_HYPSF|nr:hypothetical protein HYPSUDRAFT_63917 [Hypholoma sublateritium FD-334 SS-4]
MHRITPFLLVAFASFTSAVPSPRSTHVLHERRAMEPVEWAKISRLEADSILPMRIGLAQQNLHLVEEMLTAVSHPESPKYGQHYSAAEIVDTFKPSEETVQAVTNWLVNAGISRDRLQLSLNKGWIHVNASTAEAEDLLKTEYHVYMHPSGAKQIGCHNYSVPAHVQRHVDLIKPTVHFNHQAGDDFARRKLDTEPLTDIVSGPIVAGDASDASIPANLVNCDKQITLACLRALYKIDYTPVSTHVNTFGIVELTPQAFLPGDLDLFFKNFVPSLIGVRPTPVLIDGAVVQNTSQSFNSNGESSLDLEYGMGLTAPQPIILLQTGDLVEGGRFDNWLDAVDGSFCTFEGGDVPGEDGIYPDSIGSPQSCGIIKPPNVISTSYSQDEATATLAYAVRQCTEYAKLGMLGTTVIYSSGDNGVGGRNNVCLDVHDNEDPTNGTTFNPRFPAACPFLTAVGATQVNPGSTVDDPEGACEQVIFSGGGFSNIFAMPSYQALAVNDYVNAHLTPSPYPVGTYNTSGSRAFPDIAANGANYVIGVDGTLSLVFGTSASAPVVASVITLINDARIAIGKGPVGFINPVLYSPIFAPAFNDIVTGGNQGCGTPGFNATPGWDPVTGVGTPNFPRLLDLFKSLP